MNSSSSCSGVAIAIEYLPQRGQAALAELVDVCVGRAEALGDLLRGAAIARHLDHDPLVAVELRDRLRYLVLELEGTLVRLRFFDSLTLSRGDVHVESSA